jgi:RsiW-degrading membrane proteinase PrsW (M82 family)
VSRRRTIVLLSALAVFGAAALSAVVPRTGDYDHDAAAPLDHLARGHVAAFLSDQPLMGLVSLLLRAPAVAVARLTGGDMLVAYRAGAFVCVLAAAAFGVVLARRALAWGSASAVHAAVIVLLVAIGPATWDALVLGHPEEPLGAALCAAAALAALDRRPLLAGALLGLAVATKQWAIVAVAPVFLAAPPATRARLTATAIGVAAALTLPPMLASLGDYLAMQKGAAGAGGHVSPENLWWPFAPTRHREVFDGVANVVLEDRYLPGALIRVPHPLLVLAGFGLAAVTWWRGRGRAAVDPLALLALVFLVRCLLDPLSNVYYHAPFVLALLAWEVTRRRGLPALTLVSSLALWATWNTVASLHEPALTCATYLVWALPTAAFLALRALGLERAGRPTTSSGLVPQS